MNKRVKSNYNVLMQVQSQNESERLISIFRSGGMAVRVHRVTSEEDFNESIEDSNWDLLIVDNRHPEVSLQYSLTVIKKQQRDIPVLLLTDETSKDIREQAFKFGIQDVVNKNDNIHFVHAALREMQSARRRHQSEHLSFEFQELKKRADSLLEASDDAIVYVSDGIIIKLNEKFAQIFAYTVDELDCASIIDLVAEEDRDKFKTFFRHFMQSTTAQTELSVKGISKDKKAVAATFVFSRSAVDGEPCIQLTIADENKNTAAVSSGIDEFTALLNRHSLCEKISALGLQIGKSIPSASMMLYRLDGGNDLLDDVGFSGLDTLIKDLAKILDNKEGASIARLGDDSIAILVKKSTEKALKEALDDLKRIEAHICELQGRTYQYTCSCAVVALSTRSPALIIDQAYEGLSLIREKHGKNNADIYAPAQVKSTVDIETIGNIDELIEQGMFKLLYQPLMSLHGDTKENYEVTFWLASEQGNTYPDALLKKAANTKLDRWVILEATKALSLHRANGHETQILINLSANALIDDSLVPWLGVAIKAANLIPEMLTIQFREEDVKNNLKAAIKIVGALRNAKFRVSLGHFGADDEPFKLLKHFALDNVKLHESLNANSQLLKQVIDAAKENHLHTIVPDVDNASMLASMWQLGTDYICGSYLQLPSEKMDFEFAEL